MWGLPGSPALDCLSSGSAARPTQPCLRPQELSIPWRSSLLLGLRLLGCNHLLPSQEHPHLGCCSIDHSGRSVSCQLSLQVKGWLQAGLEAILLTFTRAVGQQREGRVRSLSLAPVS